MKTSKKMALMLAVMFGLGLAVPSLVLAGDMNTATTMPAKKKVKKAKKKKTIVTPATTTVKY